MPRTKNPSWSLYGTLTKVPHGIGRELLNLHGLPDTGYGSARRKQLNRFRGRLYKQIAFTKEGEVPGADLEQLYFDAPEVIDFVNDERLQYDVGRTIARALMDGNKPVLAFDPLTGAPSIYENADKTIAVPCDLLDGAAYDVLLNTGTVLLPKRTFGKTYNLWDTLIPMDDERCVAVNEGPTDGGMDLWSIRYMFLPLVNSDAVLGNIPDIDYIIEDMVVLAKTPWKKTLFGKWEGTYGFAQMSQEDIEQISEERAMDKMLAQPVMALAKKKGYFVSGVDLRPSPPVLTNNQNEPVTEADFRELADEAIDSGAVDPDELRVLIAEAHAHMLEIIEKQEHKRAA